MHGVRVPMWQTQSARPVRNQKDSEPIKQMISVARKVISHRLKFEY